MSTAPPPAPPMSRTLSHSGIESVFEIRTTHSMRPQEHSEPQAQLLILSRNPELVDVVRNAARSVATVVHARDLDDAGRSLPHLDPGVLLIDDAITHDVSIAIAQIARRFPEAVVVIVGTRDESNELMQLTVAGRVFRFLLMPLSFGPVRLAIAAAVAHHLERKAAGRSISNVPAEGSQPGRRRTLIYAAAVVVALLIIIGGLWQVSGLVALKPSPAAPPIAGQARAGKMTLEANPLLAQLQHATEAMAQGHYAEPAGSSALDLYRSVLQTDPNNEAARDGIRAIADVFVLRAEQAMMTESLDEAQDLLILVRSIDAEHPRLDFLDGSLTRERELRSLSERRETSNRVQQLVDAARADILAGNLIAGGSGGAAASLTMARKLDPEHPAVVGSIRDLTGALTEAVTAALNNGDIAQAKALATAANKLGSGDELMVAVDRALADAKRSKLAAIAAAVVPVTPPVSEGSESPPSSDAAVAAAMSEPAAAEQVLQAANLPRTKQVMPTYPQGAVEQGIEGYVDLEFTIATDGVPRNFNVMSATPKRTFDKAAVSCVRQWRFEPIQEDGMPVARRASLRVRFQLR